MKVALSFPSLHRRGGVERIALECANFLAERGHDVHLLATQWDAEALDARVQIHRVPARLKPPVARLASFARHSRRVLAQVPGIETLGAFGVMSPPGVLWVQSVHGAWLESSAQTRGPGGRWRQKLNPAHHFTLHLERQVFGARGYRHLIALTAGVKRDLMRLYDVPASDISVLPNGFSPTEFNVGRRRERVRVRQQLGLSESAKIVIFVANELERKGFAPLLRAIASLERNDVHLLAVGQLDARAAQSEIARLQLRERVHFSGPCNDVGALYGASDAFALPTQYEAWGLVIVEAMACGLPVVTSELAGAAVAVKNHSGVLLPDPRDVAAIARGLRRVLDAPADAEAISRSVQPFAWQQILREYERILEAHRV